MTKIVKVRSEVEDFDLKEQEETLKKTTQYKDIKPTYIAGRKTLLEKKDKTIELVAGEKTNCSIHKKAIESLKAQLDGAGEKEDFVCDKCKSVVSKQHIENEIKSNESAMKKFEAQIKILDAELKEIEDKLTETEKRLATIETWLLKEEKVKSVIKEFEAKKEILKEYMRVQNEDHSEVLKELQNEVDAAKKQQGEYQVEIGKVLQDHETKIKELQTKIDDLSGQYLEAQKDATDLQSKIDELKEKIQKIASKKSQFDAEIGSAEKTIQNIEKNQKRIADLQKTIDDEKKILNRLLILESTYGLDGIQTRIVKKYLPLLNVYIKEFLEIITDGEIDVEMFINNRSQVDIAIRGATAETFYLLSGGEKMVVRLAVNAGLALLSFSRSAQKPDIICLDEIFGPLDNCYVNRVFKLLQNLRQKFGRVLVISHRPEINNKIPKKILIEKTEGVYGRSEVRSIS